MKVYIPFNSNDFNSIFTTLSISPLSFYSNRKFSFKRATPTILNESSDFLIGFEKPIFHNKEFDNDFGFPVLIETEVSKSDNEFQITENGLKYIVIDSTIYILNNFKLIFRREKELNETFAKSLKSIETKYIDLAKRNSSIIKEDYFVNTPPSITYPKVNSNFKSITFYRERKLNRLMGATLGSSIANSISQDWQDISTLFRELNNVLSLYLNKIGDYNSIEKEQSLKIIDKILKSYENIEKLDEAIMLESTITSSFLDTLKQSKIFNRSGFELLIEGILSLPKIDLPTSLKLEKLKRAINSKFNSKYPKNYIDKINNNFLEVKLKIDTEIDLSRTNNELTSENLIKPHFDNNKLEFLIPNILKDKESEYLNETLCFFAGNDEISDLETFFINKKDILINLAKHYKTKIQDFNKSQERKYLIDLLNSFDSLRGGFNVGGINNEVLKTIAILFTSGRDLLRYIENNEKEEIQNPIIYYSIWGSIYGAATFPKTLTENLTLKTSNLNTLLIVYADIIQMFKNISVEETIGQLELLSTEKPNNKVNKVNEPKPSYLKPISILGNQVLEIINLKSEVKLSELKNISKSFKRNSDIENLINSELSDKIKVIKKGRTMYAVKNDKGLFS